MENLKSLDGITLPDVRNTYFVRADEEGNFIPFTLEYIHGVASSISLTHDVPEEIRAHFAQAQNLAVYAWFNYQFHVTADCMSMITVEYALRMRANRKSSFKHLIELAVREGWIKDEGFAVAGSGKREGKGYVETLIEVLPALRNNYAHGSSTSAQRIFDGLEDRRRLH